MLYVIRQFIKIKEYFKLALFVTHKAEGHKETLQGFITLIMVIVSQVFACVQTHKIMHYICAVFVYQFCFSEAVKNDSMCMF